nr:MAG TPA: hypothetical protein [Caudoviricetes sp.]
MHKNHILKTFTILVLYHKFHKKQVFIIFFKKLLTKQLFYDKLVLS